MTFSRSKCSAQDPLFAHPEGDLLAIEVLRERDDKLPALTDQLLEALGRYFPVLLQVADQALTKLVDRFSVEVHVVRDSQHRPFGDGHFQKLEQPGRRNLQLLAKLIHLGRREAGGGKLGDHLIVRALLVLGQRPAPALEPDHFSGGFHLPALDQRGDHLSKNSRFQLGG